MNGRWWISADGRLPHGKPWLLLASGRAIAAQTGGKLLRLVSESRLRNDPALLQLGPDPLRPGFDADDGRGAPARARAPGARSATRCSTSGSSPGSATRSATRPASPPGQPVAAGRRPHGRGQLEQSSAERRADHARVDRAGAGGPRAIYRATGAAARTAAVRSQLARPGRRQPHRLLVSALPGLSAR